MTEFIVLMNRLPDAALYLLLALGAASENLLPAVPADTFVALGGFLAGAGDLQVRWVFLGTWLFNVGGAIFVYRMSHLHGPAFFERGLGRKLLRPHQFRRMSSFYDRWGTPAIFLSRFLPGVRAVVPLFAGATHQPWSKVLLPIAIASAIWYGGLVRLGLWAGQNLDTLAAVLGSINTTLVVAASVVGLAVVIWWLWTRREPHE